MEEAQYHLLRVRREGHYKRDCRSMKRQDMCGQGQNTTTTSGTNAYASTSHGGNAPANRTNPAKPAGRGLLCLMEPGEAAYSASTDGKAQYYIDTGAASHFIEEIGALIIISPSKPPDRLPRPRAAPSKPSAPGHLSLPHH